MVFFRFLPKLNISSALVVFMLLLPYLRQFPEASQGLSLESCQSHFYILHLLL